jgi:hypothetical protein
MVIPSPKLLTAVLANLDWGGHVELPSADLKWLALELHRILTGSGKPDTCGICGGRDVTTIRTVLGAICVGCIEDLHEEVA